MPTSAAPTEPQSSPAPSQPEVSAEVDPIDELPNYVPPTEAPARQKAPEAPAPKPTATPKKTDAAPKPEAKSDDIDDLPSEPKKDDAPAPAPAPVAGEQKTIPDLRKAYESTKAEVETARRERDELKKQIEIAKKVGGEEATKAIREEMARIQKERDELNEKIKFTDYRESSEYKDKFEKPLQSAWEAAIGDIEGMTFTGQDGTIQKVTAQHISSLLRMPTGQAAAAAAEMFGAAAPEFLAHRRTILNLQKASDSAINEWKEKGSELAAARDRQSSERHARLTSAFTSNIAGLRETLPEVYGRPEDPEAAAFFDKGEKLVGVAFRGEGLDSGLTPDQRSEAIVKAQATLSARAAAFGAQRHQLIKTSARVKELEAELAKYRASEPVAGDKKAAPAASEDEEWDAGIDKLPTYQG